jgi:hypothetical protein
MALVAESAGLLFTFILDDTPKARGPTLTPNKNSRLVSTISSSDKSEGKMPYCNTYTSHGHNLRFCRSGFQPR